MWYLIVNYCFIAPYSKDTVQYFTALVVYILCFDFPPHIFENSLSIGPGLLLTVSLQNIILLEHVGTKNGRVIV